MEIRKAVSGDLPRIMEIYAFARAFMAEHGNPHQWGHNNWPPETLIREDIEQQKREERLKQLKRKQDHERN